MHDSIEKAQHTAMVRATIHVWRMGGSRGLGIPIGQNLALYANYVPNLPTVNQLRDPNHSLRIEQGLQ